MSSSISSYSSSVSSSPEYQSCEDNQGYQSSISTLDRAEVGREENKKLYGPRSNVQVQTDVTGGKQSDVDLNISEVSSDSGTASDESVDSREEKEECGTDSQLHYAQEITVGRDCYGLEPLKSLRVDQQLEYVGIIQYPVMFESVVVSEVEVLSREVFPFRAREVETIELRPGVKSPYARNGRLLSWPVNRDAPWWLGNASSPFRKLRQIPSLSLFAEWACTRTDIAVLRTTHKSQKVTMLRVRFWTRRAAGTSLVQARVVKGAVKLPRRGSRRSNWTHAKTCVTYTVSIKRLKATIPLAENT